MIESVGSRPNQPTRVLLIVYHDGWAVLDARAMATQMADACMRLGWEVSNSQIERNIFSYKVPHQFRQQVVELRGVEELNIDLSDW